MRIVLWPLGIAAALMVGALALVGLVAGAAGPSELGADRARLRTDSDQAWVVSEQRDGYQAISYPAPPISTRRIITDPAISSPLVLLHNGREVMVTGHVSCVKGDDYEIQATATQSTTGALARGRIEGRCSGRTEQYEAPTRVYDEALFAPGPAQVCGLLITRTSGKVSDVFQWCRKEDVDLRATSTS